VATYSERIIAIAEIIERHVNQYPKAADTPRGILNWWVAGHRDGDSLNDVQMALDYLVEHGRLARIVLPEGTAIYARAASHRKNGTG
jgi:hypothetical protein